MHDKRPFAVIRKWRDRDVKFVEYDADFWEGPIEAGQTGRYVRRRLTARSDRRLPDVSFRKELEAALKQASRPRLMSGETE
jgi:hypothetical protein